MIPKKNADEYDTEEEYNTGSLVLYGFVSRFSSDYTDELRSKRKF